MNSFVFNKGLTLFHCNFPLYKKLRPDVTSDIFAHFAHSSLFAFLYLFLSLHVEILQPLLLGHLKCLSKSIKKNIVKYFFKKTLTSPSQLCIISVYHRGNVARLHQSKTSVANSRHNLLHDRWTVDFLLQLSEQSGCNKSHLFLYMSFFPLLTKQRGFAFKAWRLSFIQLGRIGICEMGGV